MDLDQIILEAVNRYRTYWNSIRDIERSDFSGEVDDIHNLDYAIYEGFGTAPDSDDFYLESAVFANFLMKCAQFKPVLIDRSKTKLILEPLEPFSGFCVNIMARVQDSMRRGFPQFEKMNDLMLQIMAELLFQENTREGYLEVVHGLKLDTCLKERYSLVLKALDQEGSGKKYQSGEGTA